VDEKIFDAFSQSICDFGSNFADFDAILPSLFASCVEILCCGVINISGSGNAAIQKTVEGGMNDA
jgi:hypothetical protein